MLKETQDWKVYFWIEMEWLSNHMKKEECKKWGKRERKFSKLPISGFPIECGWRIETLIKKGCPVLPRVKRWVEKSITRKETKQPRRRWKVKFSGAHKNVGKLGDSLGWDVKRITKYVKWWKKKANRGIKKIAYRQKNKSQARNLDNKEHKKEMTGE